MKMPPQSHHILHCFKMYNSSIIYIYFAQLYLFQFIIMISGSQGNNIQYVYSFLIYTDIYLDTD